MTPEERKALALKTYNDLKKRKELREKGRMEADEFLFLQACKTLKRNKSMRNKKKKVY